jgi:hypothetical protein
VIGNSAARSAIVQVMGHHVVRCATCDQWVTRTEELRSSATDDLIVMLFCHGAIERVTIEAATLLGDAAYTKAFNSLPRFAFLRIFAKYGAVSAAARSERRRRMDWGARANGMGERV